MKTIDCSKFTRTEDLLDVILNDDEVVVLENDVNHPYFNKMKLPNPGMKFKIGDRIRLSKDLVNAYGINENEADNYRGTIVGIEMKPNGEYKYKCAFDDGQDVWHDWYDIELVMSQEDLLDKVTLK